MSDEMKQINKKTKGGFFDRCPWFFVAADLFLWLLWIVVRTVAFGNLCSSGARLMPMLSEEFWGGKASMRIQTSRDHERAWRSPTAAIRYVGGSLRVRVRYEDGKVMAWLGETMRPTLVAEEFGAMFKKLKGKGGSSVICARGICVKSWKGRKIVRK